MPHGKFLIGSSDGVRAFWYFRISVCRCPSFPAVHPPFSVFSQDREEARHCGVCLCGSGQRPSGGLHTGGKVFGSTSSCHRSSLLISTTVTSSCVYVSFFYIRMNVRVFVSSVLPMQRMEFAWPLESWTLHAARWILMTSWRQVFLLDVWIALWNNAFSIIYILLQYLLIFWIYIFFCLFSF